MILKSENFGYDFLPESGENGTFVLTYNNIELCILIQKLNLCNDFKVFVEEHGGEYIGNEDSFFEEEYIEKALYDIKLIFNNENFQNDLFKNVILTYNKKIPLEKYFHMLTEQDKIDLNNLKNMYM